ncbi:MAG: hypothetical protein RIR71_202 [Actinomycetota bacterium]
MSTPQLPIHLVRKRVTDVSLALAKAPGWKAFENLFFCSDIGGSSSSAFFSRLPEPRCILWAKPVGSVLDHRVRNTDVDGL